jgi:hypothetical protein
MDLIFVSGIFLEDCLPREKQYLYNYFRSDLQKAFIRYMHFFDSWTYFCAHTGHLCTKRCLQLYVLKLREIERAHAAAKAAMNFELLEKIEKGELHG